MAEVTRTRSPCQAGESLAIEGAALLSSCQQSANTPTHMTKIHHEDNETRTTTHSSRASSIRSARTTCARRARAAFSTCWQTRPGTPASAWACEKLVLTVLEGRFPDACFCCARSNDGASDRTLSPPCEGGPGGWTASAESPGGVEG